MYTDISYVCVLANILVWSTCWMLSRLNTTLTLLLIRRVLFGTCCAWRAGTDRAHGPSWPRVPLQTPRWQLSLQWGPKECVGSERCLVPRQGQINILLPQQYSRHSKYSVHLWISFSHSWQVFSLVCCNKLLCDLFLLGENVSCLAWYIYKAGHAKQPNTNMLIYNMKQSWY